MLHEIESELVHIDVNIVSPAPERPFWFVFTTGMSALPMHVPDDYGLRAHAELSVMLPASWVVDPLRWRREPRWYWPIRELISIARYPHRERTWLGMGHTLAGSSAPRLAPSTKFASMLVLPTMLDMNGEGTVQADVPIDLLALWPLHADELEYKLAYGTAPLLDLLKGSGVSSVLDPDRPSCIAASAHGECSAS